MCDGPFLRREDWCGEVSSLEDVNASDEIVRAVPEGTQLDDGFSPARDGDRHCRGFDLLDNLGCPLPEFSDPDDTRWLTHIDMLANEMYKPRAGDRESVPITYWRSVFHISACEVPAHTRSPV